MKNYETYTDSELIKVFTSDPLNAQIAFETIVNRYKNYVFQVCFSKLHNVEDAEDSTQEVFVRVYFGLEKFRHESEFKTWLTQIAINVTLTLILSNKRKFWKNFVSSDGDIDIETIYRSTFTPADENRFWNVVGNILRKMFPMYRKIFIFKYFKNFNLERISQKIKATYNATKMKLKRAKDQFLKILTENKHGRSA